MSQVKKTKPKSNKKHVKESVKHKKRHQKIAHKSASAKKYSKKEVLAGIGVGVGIPIFIILALILTFKGNIRVIFNEPDSKAKILVDTKPLDAKVVDWRFSEGDDAFVPLEGNHYVVVNVEMTHYFDNPTWFAPVVQTYVKDGANNKYELSPILDLNPFNADSYQPGTTATGELSYQLPRNADNLQWCAEVTKHSTKYPVCIPLN